MRRWKNNVERKSKYQSLVHDAKYGGSDRQQCQRALYCQSVIALVQHIKSYFAKYK